MMNQRNSVWVLIVIFCIESMIFPMEMTSNSHEFKRFLQDFALQKLYDDKRVFSVPWHKNLQNFRFLSTHDYLVIGKIGTVYTEKTSPASPFEFFARLRVISIGADSFGQQLATVNCLYGPDTTAALELYYNLPDCWNIGSLQYFKKRQLFKNLGEWATVVRNGAVKRATSSCSIDFCRNGVVVIADGKNGGNFEFLRFLHDLDAILQHDPTKPFKAPEGFSETEYQKNLEKYLAWLKEKEKKEDERPERELAKQRADAETAPAPRRLPAPVFIWTDETAAPGKELMRKWFPDSPEELGTWRGGYAAAPDNPAAAAVTGDSLRQRFPVVQPSSPEYKRGDAFHVSASSRDGKERYAVAVLHGRSAPEAREGLAWLCLTGGGGRLRKIGGEPVRFKKRPSLAIGDFCVSNQGEVREDGTVAPGSDAREIFFLRGDTAAMVMAEAPGGYAVEVAKWLDKLIAGALEGDGK